MNCQELARILDERDLDRLPAAQHRLAHAHLADCPACARVHDLHRRLNALPVPPLSAERIAGWRAVALLDAVAARRQRMRSRLVVVGTLVAMAAVASLLMMGMIDAPEPKSAQVMSEPQIPGSVQLNSPTDTFVGDALPAAPMAEHVAQEISTTPAMGTKDGSFTVLMLPLQVEGAHPAARAMGEEFYAGFLEKLRQVPGLVLLKPDAKRASDAKPADFRLKVTSDYGRVPERFGGHEQWLQSLVAEAWRPATGSYAQVLGFSINPDCGRISPADLANASSCTPSGMVEMDVQQLRRAVFPPDPATTHQLQTRFLDTSLPQGVRREALADLIELRQRTPGTMDPELIRVIISDAIANAPYPAQRVNLWRALRGQPAAEMIQPLISNLQRESDDNVRLEMVGTLAFEFSSSPVARSELELIAKRDASMVVRKVADRVISGGASWRSYVVSVVRDANLPLEQRFTPLAWMSETRLTRAQAGRMDEELAAISRQLFDEGEAAALADLLVRASYGPTRSVAGLLQITMSSLQHPAVADFLIATIERQPDFSAFSLLGRHRADSRIAAKLRDLAANHPDTSVRQLAAAQLDAR